MLRCMTGHMVMCSPMVTQSVNIGYFTPHECQDGLL